MVQNVPLVSVIIPVFNGERFITETISSVLAQTIADIEVIVVDDCSADGTAEMVERIARDDPRILFRRQPHNMGVALTRNYALNLARGRYIAYLDSDDLWMPEKLERQIAFMTDARKGACFTSYETIEEDGSHRNYVHVPASIGYKDFLKNTITCSHTLLFDTRIVDRSLLIMPNLKRGQDAATWMQVMKAGHDLYGLDEILAKNRKREGSLSSNRLAAVRRTWHLYRNVEQLSPPYSAYCLFWQLFHAVQKRRKD